MICPQSYCSTKILFVSKANTLICIVRDFEPASWRKNSEHRRRWCSKFVWKNGGKSVGRASPLCAKHRAFQNGKCGEHNISERLKWQEMSRSVKWTKFCKNYFLGIR